MNIKLIDLIDINIYSDSEIYENENTFTASMVAQQHFQSAQSAMQGLVRCGLGGEDEIDIEHSPRQFHHGLFGMQRIAAEQQVAE